MSVRERREDVFDSPRRAFSLLTVRAAISSARPTPWSSSESLMCSYWRARFVPFFTPRGGMVNPLRFRAGGYPPGSRVETSARASAASSTEPRTGIASPRRTISTTLATGEPGGTARATRPPLAAATWPRPKSACRPALSMNVTLSSATTSLPDAASGSSCVRACSTPSLSTWPSRRATGTPATSSVLSLRRSIVPGRLAGQRPLHDDPRAAVPTVDVHGRHQPFDHTEPEPAILARLRLLPAAGIRDFHPDSIAGECRIEAEGRPRRGIRVLDGVRTGLPAREHDVTRINLGHGGVLEPLRELRPEDR